MSTNISKKFYDISNKFTLWGAEKINDEVSHPPKLTISFRDGYPRFAVNTGVEGAPGFITFPCDYLTFSNVLEALKYVIKGERGQDFKVTSETFKWENDKPTTEMRTVSSIHIGKSDEGIVYIGIVAEGKPKMVFGFGTEGKFHKWTNSKTGQPLSKDFFSTINAASFVHISSNILALTLRDLTQDEYLTGVRQVNEIKPYQPRGNNRASPARPASPLDTSLDDDITF